MRYQWYVIETPIDWILFFDCRPKRLMSSPLTLWFDTSDRRQAKRCSSGASLTRKGRWSSPMCRPMGTPLTHWWNATAIPENCFFPVGCRRRWSRHWRTPSGRSCRRSACNSSITWPWTRRPDRPAKSLSGMTLPELLLPFFRPLHYLFLGIHAITNAINQNQ